LNLTFSADIRLTSSKVSQTIFSICIGIVLTNLTWSIH
jgi:hypothetical protein